ncbi:hypothetical protein LAJ19_21075 (plasmid) [Deinococcus taeanensis]|uniref:hypothetical protein n=1 Tax=Deinococcus taeanensis TaxID=2737050 RepID=UPI001CDD364F|nr:hypothetical protein [Deinococcus taeanensis]UBV45287.1 hypothetical protein LAJ19_21075 [Deinococcus taeanensis]
MPPHDGSAGVEGRLRRGDAEHGFQGVSDIGLAVGAGHAGELVFQLMQGRSPALA